ncbi:MAG: hypothetical protein NVV73_12045 [Cellvibrionaceae bacterium]|nr:hypothetical protein [Cellvibrionaceae bacterium]
MIAYTNDKLPEPLELEDELLLEDEEELLEETPLDELLLDEELLDEELLDEELLEDELPTDGWPPPHATRLATNAAR